MKKTNKEHWADCFLCILSAIVIVTLLGAAMWRGLAKETEWRDALYETRCAGSWAESEYCNEFYAGNSLAANYGEVK